MVAPRPHWMVGTPGMSCTEQHTKRGTSPRTMLQTRPRTATHCCLGYCVERKTASSPCEGHGALRVSHIMAADCRGNNSKTAPAWWQGLPATRATVAGPITLVPARLHQQRGQSHHSPQGLKSLTDLPALCRCIRLTPACPFLVGQVPAGGLWQCSGRGL